MVKTLIKIVAVVVVFGGLTLGAIQVHKNTTNSSTAQVTTLQSKLNSTETTVSNLQTQIKADTTSATAQFNADKAALCNYIETHVNTKTVPVPSECN